MTVDLATPAETVSVADAALFARLEAEVRESAAQLVRAHLEDTGVRFSRLMNWCDEFHRAGVRFVGRPTGPMVAHLNCQKCVPTRQKPHRRFRDSDGMDAHNYDAEGWKDGIGPDGYNRAGFDVDGYNREHVNAAGLHKYRFDAHGYDVDGYNRIGQNQEGYDRAGFNRYGYDVDGYNRDGYNDAGYDRAGYNHRGLNRDGADANGLDEFGLSVYRFSITSGLDSDGFDRSGYNRITGDRRVLKRP